MRFPFGMGRSRSTAIGMSLLNLISTTRVGNFEAELRARMIDSVRAHMVADVPVGAYVSGGLDSSIVASLAADLDPDDLLGIHRLVRASDPSIDVAGLLPVI